MAPPRPLCTWPRVHPLQRLIRRNEPAIAPHCWFARQCPESSPRLSPSLVADHPSPLPYLGFPLLNWLSGGHCLSDHPTPTTRGAVLIPTKKRLVPLLPIAASRPSSSRKTPPSLKVGATGPSRLLPTWGCVPPHSCRASVVAHSLLLTQTLLNPLCLLSRR